MYRNVDGVLAACVDFNAPEVQQLLSSDLPIVSIDYVEAGRYAVVSDNEKGMRDVLEYALEMGHKKIAYIYGEDAQVTDARLEAFHEVMNAHQHEVQKTYLRQAKYLDADLSYELTLELLRSDDRPTCILYPDDICAMAGVTAVREEGLRIGKDVSVIGYDGTPLLKMIRPNITTIEQDTEALGRKAADMLLRLIRKEHIPEDERVHYCSGTLLTGGTVETPA